MEGTKKKVLLILNCIVLSIGNCGGPLITRLYFTHGGKRIWLSSFLQTAGCPMIAVSLLVRYLLRRLTHRAAKLFHLKLRALLASVAVGVLTGIDNYLYAYGLAHLPVSTASLVVASQIAFTAAFARVLVKQKFSAYSVNAIVLLMAGAGILALHTGTDRPAHESSKEYALGFILTIVATALYGIILPLVELTYKKARQEMSFQVVMEIQLVINLSATVFCIVGMLVNNDFSVIGREARKFTIGEAKYYIVLAWTVIIWQFFFIGVMGVIYYSSSLVSAVVIAVLLPVTEILAVAFFREKFQVEKGFSLALSLWGFISYFYGEVKQKKKLEEKKLNAGAMETEMPRLADVPAGV